MFEKYYDCKVKYKDYIILIKVGNFYEAFEKDAIILNRLLGYKVKRFSKTFKLGFPLSKIDDVINILKCKNINYVLYDNNVKAKKFDNNSYNDYNANVDKVILNYIKIDRITNYLYDNVLNDNIDSVLERIEKLI